MSTPEPRIQPLSQPLPQRVAEALRRVFPPSLPPPQLYLTVARSPDLFCTLVDSGVLGPTGLFDRGALPPRLREAVILRTCAAARCEYERNLHVQTISERMGLSRSHIADLAGPRPTPGLWEPSEVALFALIDELVADIEVGDATWARVRSHFDEPTLIEITHLVGLYVGVAMMVALARPRLDRYRRPDAKPDSPEP